MKKRKKGRRFKTWAIRQPPQPRVIEREPEDLATSVSRFGEVAGEIVNHPGDERVADRDESCRATYIPSHMKLADDREQPLSCLR